MLDIEKLLERLNQLEAKIKSLESQLEASNAKVAELEAKLAEKNKDSSNSSKPPSQDPPGKEFKKKKIFNSREKTNRKPGAQNGHQGTTKKLDSNPNVIKEYSPAICTSCERSLETTKGKVVERRQEIDIPPIKPIITEHRVIEKTCPCCKHKSRGQFPDHIRSLIQFGINTIIAVIYFNIVHHIPFQRTTKILKDIFQINISEGTVENMLNYALIKATKYYDQIKELVKQSPWVGSDETTIRINGQLWWRWVWQTNKLTYFVASSSRGYRVVQEFFGEDFSGILLHDCYEVQNKTNASEHQLCFAHLMRELLFIIDFERSKWAFMVIRFLSKVMKAKEKIWSDDFDPEIREKVINDCERRLDEILNLVPFKKKSHVMWKRFKKHRDKILTFMRHKDLPATNNGSERAIRNAKIHRKVSGCFRGDHAPQRHSILLSVIETAKKQGHSLLDSCKSMLNQQLVLATWG